MKIKFNSECELPLNTTIEIPSMIIVVRAVFHESNKNYPQKINAYMIKLNTTIEIQTIEIQR